MLKLLPEQSADIFAALWESCGRTAYSPKERHQAVLYPIYKKGAPPMRRTIDKLRCFAMFRKLLSEQSTAICDTLSISTDFNPDFDRDEECNSLARAFAGAMGTDHDCAAILDMRRAYPSVQRPLLMQVLQKKVPENITKMVAVLLIPDTISTVGDDSESTAELQAGVPERSPLSPALFNLFIDADVESLESIPRSVSGLPANLFADDVT